MSDKTEAPAPTANPERYARMAAPYPTTADAEAAMRKFLDGLEKLREECRVAEVLVMVATHHEPDPGDTKKNKTCMLSLALGHSDAHPVMAAYAYRAFAMPAIEKADTLRSLARGDDP